MMKELYNKSMLSNGLRVVSERVPYVRSVSVGVWVNSGSRYEPESEAGISHFIEHLLFKGTERRTARQIAEEIDSVGGQLNAFTGKEYTCFYCRVLDEHISLALDLLSDMIQNSLFRDEDIEKERGVIAEEIRMYEDAPDELVHDLLAGTMWDGHPLGRAIIGNTESINAINRERILEYFKGFYKPDNMVIAVAGNLDDGRIAEEIEKRFSGLSGTSFSPEQRSPEQRCTVKVRRKDTEQVHVCVGTEGVRLEDEQFYPLSVLNTILGGGTSSRLFQRIREEKGLAYSVYSYHTAYKDTGLFAVYAGIGPNYVREVLQIARNEFERFREQGPTDEELTRGKEQLKGGLMLGLESTSNRMTRLGRNELLLRYVTPLDEIVEKIESVTKEDILAVADTVLRPEKMTLTAVGPIEEEVLWTWNP